MSYEIIPNRFAPKRLDRPTADFNTNSHSLCYNRCNFNCPFCDFRERPLENYKNFDNEEFETIVLDLLKKGKNFKFTGGEPTLNPDLIEHLQIVKKHHGYIYLDSNGHNPKLLHNIMEKSLIDVLGISLKGLTAEEAQKTSRVKKDLCWDNVLETLTIASQYKNIRTIVTAVFTKENTINRLNKLAEILHQFPYVFMKINNLQVNNTSIANGLEKVNPLSLQEEVKEFVDQHNEWKNRTILINSKDAIEDYSKILFL